MDFLFVFATVLLGLFIHEVLRRRPNLAWLLFFLIPIGLFPFWITSNHISDWFVLAKTTSICIGACLISWLRLKHNYTRRIGPLWVYSIFLLNILLAVWRALLVGSLPALFNALTGLLLVALYPPLKSISIAPDSPKDFCWDISYSWIFGYSLWIFLFVAVVYPTQFFFGIAAVLPPLLLSFFRKNLWLQCRVYTLAFYLLIANTYPYVKNLETSSIQLSEAFLLILTGITCGWMGLLFTYEMWKRAKNLWIR